MLDLVSVSKPPSDLFVFFSLLLSCRGYVTFFFHFLMASFLGYFRGASFMLFFRLVRFLSVSIVSSEAPSRVLFFL